MLRRIFYFGKSYEHFKFDTDEYINTISDPDILDDDVVSVVKFTNDEKYLLCGDNAGNLHIYDLETFEQINFASLHNIQITCIDILYKEKNYLATGSQDGLIHVIDISNGIDKDMEVSDRSTLSDHEGPILSIVFTTDSYNKTKLITCAADNMILFYDVTNALNIQLCHKVKEDDMNTYSLADNTKFGQLISGHNGKITIWRSSNYKVDKIFHMTRGNKLIDNFRIAVDKTGTIMAISCNDKYVRIRSVINGELFAKIPAAEIISSLCFSIHNSYLIASSV
jgi:WD40 repeat protein